MMRHWFDIKILSLLHKKQIKEVNQFKQSPYTYTHAYFDTFEWQLKKLSPPHFTFFFSIEKYSQLKLDFKVFPCFFTYISQSPQF